MKIKSTINTKKNINHILNKVKNRNKNAINPINKQSGFKKPQRKLSYKINNHIESQI